MVENRCHENHAEEREGLLARLKELERENQELRSLLGMRANGRAAPASDELYHFLFEHIGDAVVMADADTGEIMGCNQATERMLGYPREELLGMHHGQLHPTEEQGSDGLSLEFREARHQPNTIHETEVRTADGEMRQIEIHATRVDMGERTFMVGVFRDVTGHRGLRFELERFFHLSPDMVVVGDLETGTFVDVNPAARTILGYTPEEFLGKGYLEWVHPEDHEATLAVMGLARQGDPVQGFTNRVRHRDGSYRWLQWYSYSDTLYGRAYAVARDVTALKEAEQRIRESEEKFSSLFQHMVEGVALHEMVRDESGRAVDYLVVDVNPAYEAILRRDSGQVIGRLASEIYGLNEAPYLETYEQVVQTGEAERFEIFFEPLDIHFSVSAFRYADGCFATVFEDISDRVRTRKKLERSVRELSDTKALLEAVVEQSPIPILVGSFPSNRMHIVNRAYMDNLDLSDEERVIIQDPGRFLEFYAHWKAYSPSGEELAREDLPMYRALRGEVTDGLEYRIVSSDGRERWKMGYGAPIYNAEGELIAGVMFTPDVTERRRAEELIIQTEKMMTVGALAAGMAHEINNPLAIVLAAVHNLRRRVSPEVAKNRTVAQQYGVDVQAMHGYLKERGILDYLIAMDEAGQRAAQIVRSMLDFSRLGGASRETCDVRGIVDRAVDLAAADYDLERQYDFRAITLHTEFAEDLPHVRVVGREIEQVLLNLFKNAAQAMAGDNHSGDAPTITVRAYQSGDAVCVEVEDNGPGMSDDLRKQVFDPFFTTKDPDQGTGLGLSVSYFIVTRKHGGMLTVRSTPGVGTTFSMTLPRVSDSN